jgi:hypothetical protein
MLPSEEGSAANYKPNCLAWYNPYAEILLETDFERCWQYWRRAPKQQSFSAIGNQLLTEPHRACSAPELRPGVQFGREARRSENIEFFKTPLSEEL